jgi:hypothetical protein
MMSNAPKGFLQWKGTDACLDFHCVCGESIHFDALFLYSIQCPYCERIYNLSSEIQAVEVSREEAHGDPVRPDDDPVIDFTCDAFWIHREGCDE